MSLFPVRLRLVSALRWLAPSAVAACAGALAAGLVEGRGAHSVADLGATIGLLAVLVFPVLLGLGLVVRALIAGWRPADLVAGMIEDGGGAPRLVGWFAVVGLGTLGVAWSVFQGTWLLVAWTAFKPITISFVLPVIAVATTLAVVALSRPAATTIAWVARGVDRRWRRRGHGTLLRPRTLIVVTLGLAAATCYAIWIGLVRRRIGSFDLSLFYAPGVALVMCAVTHAAWNAAGAGRTRVIAGVTLGLALTAAAGSTVVVATQQPTLMLGIWGERPIAGLVIERLFKLEELRASISLSQFRPVDRPGAVHPDIVLVTIDTVRADHTPPYGGTASMPVLGELGTRGTVFSWAFAPSNVTRRSIPSMVIGLHPHRVKGRVVGWALRVDPRHVLLAERLRAGGYETAGFMCCKGFWGEEARTGLARGLEHVEIDPSGILLAKRARAWLDVREQRPDRKPLFLWMHILEPHNWLAGGLEPRTDDERRRMYDRSLTASDGMLLELLGAFSNRKPEDAPIAIVTADHGESLGEHGAPFHSTDLYNSQLRVPLVIAGPGVKAHRVLETVSLTDLTPTIIELAGFEPPREAMDGRSIADLISGKRRGDPAGGIAYASMIKDRSNPGGISVIVRGQHKLIDNGVSLELYDIHADPNEQRNIIIERPSIAADLKKMLDAQQAMGSPFP